MSIIITQCNQIYNINILLKYCVLQQYKKVIAQSAPLLRSNAQIFSYHPKGLNQVYHTIATLRPLQIYYVRGERTIPILLQVYKGLDVVTAKASRQEQELVPHHLLDILEPHQFFTVVDFRDRALKIIDNLIQQNKIPIIVGGTNYYIESIVYNILVQKTDDSEQLLWDKTRRKRELEDDKLDDEHQSKKLATDSNDESSTETVEKIKENSLKDSSDDKVKERTIEIVTEAGSSTDDIKVKQIDICPEKLKEDVANESNFTNEEIHSRLEAIDPVMAKRLHPNNRRKVLRSIEVWLQTGRRHSEVLDEQNVSEGQLRRPGATIIFWLKCEREVHDQRLDARVDKMLEEGLIEELLDFHARHNRHRLQDGEAPDYTKGVFQTLGFKEFHEYLIMSEEQRNSEDGKKLLIQSIENMKSGTKRYARRQMKMVRGRFIDHPRREVPPIYELDTTDLTKWDEEVRNKAILVIESYLNKSSCEYKPISMIEEKKGIGDVRSHNFCTICNRLLIGDKVYAIHLKSNRHMKVLKKKKRLEEYEEKKKGSESKQSESESK